jgi:hypothetical protein
MGWDGAFQQSLSAASQPEHYSEELPRDLEPDEDELLLVDISEDEGSMSQICRDPPWNARKWRSFGT